MIALKIGCFNKNKFA